jgi:hypothetical protein
MGPRFPSQPTDPPAGCSPGCDPNYCKKCGATEYGAGSFNHICKVNAFGRCERVQVPANGGTGFQELARIQLRDSQSWVVTVSVAEITSGAVVQAKVIYGGGNVNTEAVFDVGDRVDIPVMGNSVRVIALVSGSPGAAAQVCASIAQGDWGNTAPPDHFRPGSDFSIGGDLLPSEQVVFGPARLIGLTAFLESGAAGYLMLFDSSAPATGAPRWVFPIPAAGSGGINIDFSGRPLTFSQGIFWAISSTGDVLTPVPADQARVDLWFADQPDSVITTSIPDTTGPHIP